MKRFGNLYPQIYAMENIHLAHRNARRGKSRYSEVKKVNADSEKYFTIIHDLLKNKTFKNAPYQIFTRNERGKEREIFKLPYFPDRIIHHCIMQVLEPIWMKSFIRDTYASMKGRGIHDGVNRMKGFLKDSEGTRYCLKLDVKKFYPSINHDILKKIVRRKIKCRDTLGLVEHIIDSAKGVPIGNYLSQHLANLYLSPFDHWMKEEKRIKYYARYCDDIVILHHDKVFLHALFKEIQRYMHAHLSLEIKSNWQVFPTHKRGIDFLGYRFFGKYTLIRKTIAKRFKLKILKRINSSIMSYYGWLMHGNGHNLWLSQCRKLLEKQSYTGFLISQKNIHLSMATSSK